MSLDQDNFVGNGKHLKEILRALDAGNIGLWNDFAAAQGPGFRADLRGINLKAMDLTGIKLPKARLVKADLEGCILKGADLSDAELAGASLKGADLAGAKIKLVIKAKKPTIDPKNEDPEIVRRRRMALQQEQAERLLAERAKKEAVKKAEDERRALRDRPLFRADED